MSRAQVEVRPGRGAALLCLAVLAAAQLIALVHHLAVQHVRCPVHGDVIHADSPDHVEAVARDWVPDPIISAAHAKAEHQHDECGVAIGVAEGVAPARAVEAGRVAETPAPRLPHRAAPRVDEIVALAPKTSPPA